MADPKDPLTMTEKLIFGHDAVRDPVTGEVFEQGLDAHPREQQTALFIRQRDQTADMPRHETDVEFRRRVEHIQREMQQQGIPAEAIAAAVAKEVPMRDCCPATGREYETGSGAQTKSRQTERFIEESGNTELQELSVGPKLFADAHVMLDSEWLSLKDGTTKMVDPNDPTLPERFLKERVEPTLDGLRRNFTTAKSKAWAESSINILRDCIAVLVEKPPSTVH
jgi:hypothetical protein